MHKIYKVFDKVLGVVLGVYSGFFGGILRALDVWTLTLPLQENWKGTMERFWRIVIGKLLGAVVLAVSYAIFAFILFPFSAMFGVVIVGAMLIIGVCQRLVRYFREVYEEVKLERYYESIRKGNKKETDDVEPESSIESLNDDLFGEDKNE